MSQIWQAILLWMARAMECLAELLQSWAEFLRGTNEDPRRELVAMRETNLEELEQPPTHFGPRTPAASSKVLAGGAPPHWLADLRRLQAQAPSEEQDVQSAPTPAAPARLRQGPIGESPRRSVVQTQRQDGGDLPDRAFLPKSAGADKAREATTPPLKPSAAVYDIEPENATLPSSEQSSDASGNMQFEQSARPVKSIRLLRPLRQQKLAVNTSVVEPALQLAVDKAAVPVEREELSTDSRGRSSPGLLVAPAAEIALPPTPVVPNLKRRNFPVHRETETLEPDEAQDEPTVEIPSAIFQAAELTWPKPQPQSEAARRHARQPADKAVDTYPWPSLPRRRSGSAAKVGEEVLLRQQMRAAERAERLEREQRGR